jgi:hypothetical protein
MLFVFLPMQKLSIKGRDLDTEVYDEHYDRESGSDDESQGENGNGKANGS